MLLSKLSLLAAIILSTVVASINFFENRYIYGAVMSIVALLVLIELIKQFKNEST